MLYDEIYTLHLINNAMLTVIQWKVLLKQIAFPLS